MHGQGTREQGLAAIPLLGQGQNSDQEGPPGGEGEDSVYTQGSGGWNIIPSPHTLLTALGITSPTLSRKLSKDVRKVAAGVPVIEHPGCGKLGHLLLKVG